MAREQFQTLTEPMYYILLALTEECCGGPEDFRRQSKGRAGDLVCYAVQI